ncbi:MAG: hypothetical protein V4658_07230 [Bacteroidota bacterium]
MLNTNHPFFACIAFFLLTVACNGQQDASQAVYITATGNTYHRHTCRYLGEPCVPVQVEDAVVKEYMPCSDCMGAN